MIEAAEKGGICDEAYKALDLALCGLGGLKGSRERMMKVLEQTKTHPPIGGCVSDNWNYHTKPESNKRLPPV